MNRLGVLADLLCYFPKAEENPSELLGLVDFAVEEFFEG